MLAQGDGRLFWGGAGYGWGVTERMDWDEVSARLVEVRGRVEAARVAAGRPLGSVRLVAVSKTKPVAAIRAAYEAGQRDFGENYVQELNEKASALADLPDIRFHFIGALQRNKARFAAGIASLVHTVDRRELVVELDKRAGALGRRLDVLLEVNVGGEASKAGCSPAGLSELLAFARGAAFLRVVGLMAIPPMLDDAEAMRPFFAALRALRDAHGGPELLPELSMGMSHDFLVAIQEGATLVRVGTAIFGSR